jgi:hypothetical protein
MEKKFIEIDYSPYEETESDIIPDNIKTIIEEKNWVVLDDYIVKVRNVKSPFMLADNSFDLRECNNDIYLHGAEKTKEIIFTGGAMLIECEKTEDLSFILHGNDEEGYNIFILE